MTFKLDDIYVQWIELNVQSLFQDQGISITPSAKLLMTLALEAQVVEGRVSGREELFGRLESAWQPRLVEHYRARFGTRPVDFNRAYHLIYDMNNIVLMFPTSPT